MTYVTSQPRKTPAEPSPREMIATTTYTNATRMKSRPLGMAREGLSMNFRPLGELGGPAISCCFCTASGGLFERPTAAFFTVVAAVVMHGMTVGMVATMRRKTRFPTGVTDRHTQAKPPATATAFCCFGITLFIINDCNICRCPADIPAAVTPAAKRNSYRVAGRKPHPGLPQGEGTQCQWIRL